MPSPSRSRLDASPSPGSRPSKHSPRQGAGKAGGRGGVPFLDPVRSAMRRNAENKVNIEVMFLVTHNNVKACATFYLQQLALMYN